MPHQARKDAIVAAAHRLGFEAVAVASASAPISDDFAHYQAFVAAGYHGEMSYLAANAAARERVDTDAILVGAKSVICVAARYAGTPTQEAAEVPFARRIARYARGHDYHNGLRRKLRKLAQVVRAYSTAPGEIRARPIMDDAPLLERAWAARAGLGFVGKNGLLIVPGRGSYVLLGEVVTNLELPADSPISGRCGSCTRCLDVCPTQAFAAPFVLDARRCVAYLTIEQRSDLDPELAARMQPEHFFGCDDCQSVCPFNAGQHRELPRLPLFESHPRWATAQLADFLQPEAAAALASQSPLSRPGPDGLARNAVWALRAEGDAAAHAQVVAAAAAHPSEAVRRSAASALARWPTPSSATLGADEKLD